MDVWFIKYNPSSLSNLPPMKTPRRATVTKSTDLGLRLLSITFYACACCELIGRASTFCAEQWSFATEPQSSIIISGAGSLPYTPLRSEGALNISKYTHGYVDGTFRINVSCLSDIDRLR